MGGGKPGRSRGSGGAPRLSSISGKQDAVGPMPVIYGTPSPQGNDPVPSTTAWGGGRPGGTPRWAGSGFDAKDYNYLSSLWGGFGNTPSTGLPAFGATQLPTNWVNYPGVGLVPMAVPIGPDANWSPPALQHTGQQKKAS